MYTKKIDDDEYENDLARIDAEIDATLPRISQEFEAAEDLTDELLINVNKDDLGDLSE